VNLCCTWYPANQHPLHGGRSHEAMSEAVLDRLVDRAPWDLEERWGLNKADLRLMKDLVVCGRQIGDVRLAACGAVCRGLACTQAGVIHN